MDLGFYGMVAVIILGVFFLFLFRRSITDFINRLRSVGKEGLTTYPNQTVGGVARDPRAEAEELLRTLDNALVVEAENFITDELNRRGLAGADAVPVLKRFLASAGIALQFEQHYRVIFGSQLKLLNYLNIRPGGHPIEEIRPFYDEAVSKHPDIYKTYAYEQWLGFLRGALLIRDDAGQTSITVKGREFLAFLVRMGYTQEKGG